MAYTTINKSSDHFNTVQWTGNASTNAITGVGFRPDWIWGKSHTSGYSHQLYDVVRGATYSLKTNGTTAQETLSTGLTSFDSDGFTLGSNTNINASGHTVTGWNWKAGNAQGSSNTDGSINTTYTSVNTTAGFSISNFAGTDQSSGTATIGHGLGVVPQVIIEKKYSNTQNWNMYHTSLGNGSAMRLNLTDAKETQTDFFGDTTPTSSLVTLGPNCLGAGNHILYCFAEKTGFSKFGSYTGNGNASNAPFIYTGFKPAFVLHKRTDSTSDWDLFDNKRVGYNVDNRILAPNTNAAEVTATKIDLLSNGFKLRTSTGGNYSGTYIYMAFAEAPLVGSNNVPCTAR
jgi:hypothetical protein